MTLSSDQMVVLMDSDSVPHDPTGLDSSDLIRPAKLCGLDRLFAPRGCLVGVVGCVEFDDWDLKLPGTFAQTSGTSDADVIYSRTSHYQQYYLAGFGDKADYAACVGRQRGTLSHAERGLFGIPEVD